MLNYSLLFEFVGFLFSLLLLHPSIKNKHKWFTVYCLIVLVVEGIGVWVIEKKIISNNHIIYDIAVPFFASFCLLIVRSYLEIKPFRKVANTTLSIYLLIQITYLFNSKEFVLIERTTRMISADMATAVVCMLYYIEFLKKERVIYVIKEPSFFVVTGLFCFSILSSIVFTLKQLFINPSQTGFLEYKKIFNETTNISSGILYLCFSIAFYMIWKQRNQAL